MAMPSMSAAILAGIGVTHVMCSVVMAILVNVTGFYMGMTEEDGTRPWDT